jgi:DNA-binding HxlR family transcriptional regulator
MVGERWTLIIIRDAMLRGTTHFNGFRRGLNITASVLATRLRRLTAAGIFERVLYGTRPPRYEYHLTPKGWELATVLLALMRWGDRHLAGEAGAPVAIDHRGCGGTVEPQLICLDCATEVPPTETVASYRHRPTGGAAPGSPAPAPPTA